MTRRTVALVVAIATIISAALAALPVSASHQRDVDPTTISPASLKLPSSSLPAGSVIDHDGVSDNQDADGRTTPADGQKSRMGPPIHHNFYDVLGRLTGYRQDFRFRVGDVEMGTEYLVSVYPDSVKAQAAMDDIVGPASLIKLVLGTPLDPQCHTGDACASYFGPNPLHPGYDAVFAVFRRGAITVETGSEIPTASFATVRSTAQTMLYSLLDVADAQIRLVLNPAGSTVVPTNTPQSSAVPTPTSRPSKRCPKNSAKKGSKCVCKKGYTMKKGKCVKKK